VCCFLQDLHARLQPLLIFMIDGASYIDAADSKWEVVAAVMHTEGKQQLVSYALQDRGMGSAQQLRCSLLLAASQIIVICRLLCHQHLAEIHKTCEQHSSAMHRDHTFAAAACFAMLFSASQASTAALSCCVVCHLRLADWVHDTLQLLCLVSLVQSSKRATGVALLLPCCCLQGMADWQAGHCTAESMRMLL
jgi:hypothetical protein